MNKRYTYIDLIKNQTASTGSSVFETYQFIKEPYIYKLITKNSNIYSFSLVVEATSTLSPSIILSVSANTVIYQSVDQYGDATIGGSYNEQLAVQTYTSDFVFKYKSQNVSFIPDSISVDVLFTSGMGLVNARLAFVEK